MEKNKKILIIGGIVEGAFLIFALIVSILVWTTAHKADDFGGSVQKAQEANLAANPFIGTFQNNTMLFFCIICIPVFVIVAIDLVYFAIIASKKESALTSDQREAIRKKAEEEVRSELMKEILAENAAEEAKAEAKVEVKEEVKPEEKKE